MAETGLEDAVTRDAFFGGRLVLAQPEIGHRSGTDAVLLAASAPRGARGRIYDAGAGVGAVGLGVAMMSPAAHVVLIEADERYAQLAEANIAANGLADRVGLAACDLLSRTQRRERLPGPATLVLTNPPFHDPGRVRASPDPLRRAAHVMRETSALADWLLACLACLEAKGTLIAIHHVAALPEMLATLAPRLGDLCLLPVQSREGQPAKRILVRGRKGSRAPLRIAAPLVLHEGDAFTERAARLHAGDAALDW